MNVTEFDSLMSGHAERERQRLEHEQRERQERSRVYQLEDKERRQRQLEQREPATIEHADAMLSLNLKDLGVSIALAAVANDRAGQDLVSGGCAAGGLEMLAQVIADSLPAGVVRTQFEQAARCSSSLAAERNARLVVGLAGMIVELRTQLEATQHLASPVSVRDEISEMIG